MVANKKVVVCISTYNGEKYIKTQLDSVINQTYSNVDIYVRDDGSTDNTIKILKEYALAKKIHLIQGKNIGVASSFCETLKTAYNIGDYFAFCDQDDKWHKNKIERAVKKIEKENQKQPLLYFSAFNYCDEELNFIKKSSINKSCLTFGNSLVECIPPGMTMLFNKKLAAIAIKTNNTDICYHDWWVYLIATSLGKIIYDPEATTQYRRTGGNVSPAGKNVLQLQLYRVKKFVIGKYFKKIKQQIYQFKKIFINELCTEDQKLLNLFSMKYNFIKSIKKVFYRKRFRQTIFDEILCRILFFFGKL